MSEIKKKVIDAIKNLPDDASYEDIMEVVLVQEKISLGLKQVDEDKVISDKDMQAEFVLRQENHRKFKNG